MIVIFNNKWSPKHKILYNKIQYEKVKYPNHQGMVSEQRATIELGGTREVAKQEKKVKVTPRAPLVS